MRLTDEMKEMVERLRLCYIATVTTDGRVKSVLPKEDVPGARCVCRGHIDRNPSRLIAREQLAAVRRPGSSSE